MNVAARLFEQSLNWLRESYDDFLFRTEFDVVTALWGFMVRQAEGKRLGVVVDYEQNIAIHS
jgi:hypothetical protein